MLQFVFKDYLNFAVKLKWDTECYDINSRLHSCYCIELLMHTQWADLTQGKDRHAFIILNVNNLP